MKVPSASMTAVLAVMACLAPAARADFVSTILADNPTGYWRLDESSGIIAHDSSGHGYDGTYLGGYTLGQPGAIGDGDTAVALDGSTGLVGDIPGGTFNAPNNFSVEAWVKQATTDGVQQMISNGSIGFEITGGQVEVTFFGVQDIYTGIYVPQDGRFHQIVETVDGANNVTVYLDGVSLFTSTFIAPAQLLGYDLALGSLPYNSEYFNGVLDEAAFYNHVLSADRVMAHYLAASETAAVPEPGSLILALMAVGTFGVPVVRRYRRAS
jgi:Concanavalin A-like lectin/glucanases superfamily/PEP-CTERM motif